MKQFVFLFSLLFCLASFSQNKIDLSVSKKPDNPLSSYSHEYVLNLENNISSEFSYEIITEETNCNNLSNASLKHDLLNSFNSKIEEAKIFPNSNSEFKIKLSKKSSTQLNSWYCLSVKIRDKNTGEILSNTLTIKHFIPDPKNFM